MSSDSQTPAESHQPSAESARAIRAAVDSRHTEMHKRLRDLVSIETPSGDVARSAQIAATLVDRLANLGGTARVAHTENGSTVIAEFAEYPASASESRPILLLGHSDTVWPLGTLDDPVPWIERDGANGPEVAGPGTYDMKSGLVVIETALAVLRELGLPHPPLRVLVTCDEEIGSPTTSPLVAENARAACAVLSFESPHPDGALKVGRRGSTRVRLTVTGREAHAALDPEKGISAVDELVDQLIVVRAIVAAANKTAPGSVLCNVGALEAPGRANVIPAQASALIGLRFTDQTAEDDVLAQLASLTPLRAGAVVEAEVLSRRPTWQPTAADRALLDAVADAAAAVGQRLTGHPAAGAGDTNLTGSLGIPSLDGFGPRGAGAHAVNEHIELESFFERAVLLSAVLGQWRPLD